MASTLRIVSGRPVEGKDTSLEVGVAPKHKKTVKNMRHFRDEHFVWMNRAV
jgi:hypothetical protein